MYCDKCKDPFVNPELNCLHQCDDENQCKNGGECAVVDEDSGVSEFTSAFFYKPPS